MFSSITASHVGVKPTKQLTWLSAFCTIFVSFCDWTQASQIRVTFSPQNILPKVLGIIYVLGGMWDRPLYSFWSTGVFCLRTLSSMQILQNLLLSVESWSKLMYVCMGQSFLGMVFSESPQGIKLSFESLHFVLLFKLTLYLRWTIEKLNQKKL